jgi:hypothetical protein
VKEKDTKINKRLSNEWKIVSLPNYSNFKGTAADIEGLIGEVANKSSTT